MSRLTPKEREKNNWWKNKVSLSNALDKLAHYEDLEEQGRLIELPCKIGDYVYDISDGTAYKTRILQFVMFEDHLACRTVSGFPDVEAFGKRVFLTKAEAEAKLEEVKGGAE